MIKNLKNSRFKKVWNYYFLKYAQPIELQEYCIKNKIKVLTLKSDWDSYVSCVNKDFRGVLEGVWQLSKWHLEQVDYILGIYAGTIYGVYKLIKGSNEVIGKAYAGQNKWDRWNQIHLNMGRPERYALDLDKVINEGNKTKTVLKLSPVAIPPTQFVLVPLNITDKDKKIGKELLNRTISNRKVKGRSGKYYFGEFK